MNIAAKNLGCRLNQAELQSVISELQMRGHSFCGLEENPDAAIVNSCVVTAVSEQKTRQLVSKALSSVAADGLVVVTGCFARNVERRGRVLYVPNDYKYLIADILEGRIDAAGLAAHLPGPFSFQPALRGNKTRAGLKIQDGCENYCAYCIIPYTRGPSVSRPANDVLREFRQLRDNGYREIVLTGVQVGNYCHDKLRLDGLLEMLLAEAEGCRLHLSSISPLAVDARVRELLLHPAMVRHLHMSLQSGSGKILAAMNRHYTPGQYLEIIEEIRGKDPLYNFTTDVITGFPGETDADHAQTLEVVRRAAFSHVHVFRFSMREGTAAASLTDEVPADVKACRSADVSAVAAETRPRYIELFQGHEAQVLVERSTGDESSGYNEYYLPVTIRQSGEKNTIVRVRLRPDDGRLTGEVID